MMDCTPDLIDDWEKLTRQKVAFCPTLDAGVHQSVDQQMVELIFSLCRQFGLPFEVQHTALDYFERTLGLSLYEVDKKTVQKSRAAPMIGEVILSKVRLGYLEHMLACVQLASKMICSRMAVVPKNVHAKFPDISIKKACLAEVKVLKHLDDTVRPTHKSLVPCIEILVVSLDRMGLMNAVAIRQTVQEVLSFTTVKRWHLMCYLYENSTGNAPRTPPELQSIQELLYDYSFIASGIVAASGFIMNYDVRALLGALAQITSIEALHIGSLTKAILMEVRSAS